MSALLESWTGLTWRHPGWLALALLVPVALLLRRRRAAALRFAPHDLLAAGEDGSVKPLPRSWRVALLPLPRALQALGILFAVVAMARPVHRSEAPRQARGIDIVLGLDVSSSMTTNDMDRRRTRLEVVREAAARFVAARPHDRIGLVTFARYPDVRCPPTLDHAALARILAETTPVEGDGPEDATGIGTAVARAAQVLQAAGARSRVVVLLTDGEENVALPDAPGEIAPAHAAQLCERLGVRVYAVVAGTGRRTPSGTWVRPDTGPVERLARRTGGALLEAPDAAAMAAVYGRIDALEKTVFDEPRYDLEDRFLPFLLLGLSLLLAGRLLESTALDVLP